MIAQCTKAKSGKNRRLHINPTWKYLKVLAIQWIEESITTYYYTQRKIDIDMVVGNINQNRHFRSFHVQGVEKIFKEIGFFFLAHNFRKLIARIRKYRGKTKHSIPKIEVNSSIFYLKKGFLDQHPIYYTF